MFNIKSFFVLTIILGSLNYCSGKEIPVDSSDSTLPLHDSIIITKEIFSEGWANLPQTMFWHKVINLHSDSALINIAATRKVLEQQDFHCWLEQEEDEKDVYRDSLKKLHQLNPDEKIYVTSGKRFYYRIKDAKKYIPNALKVFENEEVDPWYAQTILLIESPGRLTNKSNVGAYGPFQLMKSVARNRGLLINDTIDEREDIHRSAWAAATFIKKVCIPELKRHLEPLIGTEYNETDLWFRLLVMHVYHAGAGNVGGALRKVNPKEGNIELIKKLWKTEYRGFKNASQNYTQIALAAHIELMKQMGVKI